MTRAISNLNVLNAQFERADFTGRWLASIGRPELRGSWIIYGGSGSGKTTFTLQLSKYITEFRRVAYDSLEQGLSASMQVAWKRVKMEEAGNNIMLLSREHISDLKMRLRKRWSPQVIVVDSVQYMLGFRMSDYVKLLAEFSDRKLFIWVSHEEEGKPAGKLAKQILYDSDVKMRVEGYKAFITTRYENQELNEGGAPYIIWEEGAARFCADLQL